MLEEDPGRDDDTGTWLVVGEDEEDVLGVAVVSVSEELASRVEECCSPDKCSWS